MYIVPKRDNKYLKFLSSKLRDGNQVKLSFFETISKFCLLKQKDTFANVSACLILFVESSELWNAETNNSKRLHICGRL